MSIGLSFTGRIDGPRALLEAAKVLAEERKYHLAAGEGGLKVTMCPLGGELGIMWRPEGESSGPWLVRGGCTSTPAGAGLHRAAVELLDNLPIRALAVEDETGFFRHRDFQRMKKEHFYPWLRTLVDVCRRESGKGVSGMQLCWSLEQYAPEDIPDTVVTPMGRFRLAELVELEERGIEALADRFFLWDGRTQDARFFRNRAINALWENCFFAPSLRSQEDAAEVLDELMDRYGDPPKPVYALLDVAMLRSAAARAGISDISQKDRQLRFVIAQFNPEAVANLCGSAKYRRKLVVNAGEVPALTLTLGPKEPVLESALGLVEDLLLAAQR